MSDLDLNGVPPGTPPPSPPPPQPRPPSGPGRPPTNPPPPSKDVMHDLQWPDDVPFPTFRKRYPKAPKAPKPPADLHGNCRKTSFFAALLTLIAMARNWRELPSLLRDTEAYR